MSNLIDLPDFVEQYNPSTGETGSIVAFFALGAGVGALISILFVEEIGRVRSIQLGACVMMLGAILMSSSFSTGQLIAGRFVCGLGLGVNTSAIPAWHSECSPKRKRGALITIDFVLVNLGLFFAYWFDYGLSLHTSGSFTYRFPMAFQIIFELTIFVSMFFLPESPRWLAVHGRKETALKVLAQLHGQGVTPDSHVILSQYESIMQSAELEGAMDSNNFADLFTMGPTKNFKRLIMGAGVQFMNPWTGINILSYYFPYILNTVLQKSEHYSAVLGGLNALTYVLCIIPSIFMVDLVGRRVLLVIGSAGQSACMAIMTGMLYMVLSSPNADSYGEGAIAMVFIFGAIFVATWMPLSFMYAAELMPIRIRSKGCSIATAMYWLGSFATTEILPKAIANIEWRFFIVFAVTNFVFIFVFAFLYPETKQLSLEEIDLLFTGEEGVTSEAALKIHEGALADDYRGEKMPSSQTIEVASS